MVGYVNQFATDHSDPLSGCIGYRNRIVVNIKRARNRPDFFLSSVFFGRIVLQSNIFRCALGRSRLSYWKDVCFYIAVAAVPALPAPCRDHDRLSAVPTNPRDRGVDATGSRRRVDSGTSVALPIGCTTIRIGHGSPPVSRSAGHHPGHGRIGQTTDRGRCEKRRPYGRTVTSDGRSQRPGQSAKDLVQDDRVAISAVASSARRSPWPRAAPCDSGPAHMSKAPHAPRSGPASTLTSGRPYLIGIADRRADRRWRPGDEIPRPGGAICPPSVQGHVRPRIIATRERT